MNSYSSSSGNAHEKLLAAVDEFRKLQDSVSPSVVTTEYLGIKLQPKERLFLDLIATSRDVCSWERMHNVAYLGRYDADKGAPGILELGVYLFKIRDKVTNPHNIHIATVNGFGCYMSQESKNRLFEKIVPAEKQILRWNYHLTAEDLANPKDALSNIQIMIKQLKDVIDPQKQPEFYLKAGLTRSEARFVNVLAKAAPNVISYDRLSQLLYDDRVGKIPHLQTLDCHASRARSKLRRAWAGIQPTSANLDKPLNDERFIFNSWDVGFYMPLESRKRLETLEGLPLTDAEIPKRPCKRYGQASDPHSPVPAGIIPSAARGQSPTVV